MPPQHNSSRPDSVQDRFCWSCSGQECLEEQRNAFNIFFSFSKMEKLVQKRIFHGSTCQVMALACAKKGRSPAQGTSGQSTAHTAKKRCHQFIVECAQWHATTITTISLATTVTATMTMVGKRLNGFFGELLFCWDAGIQNAYSRVLGWDVSALKLRRACQRSVSSNVQSQIVIFVGHCPREMSLGVASRSSEIHQWQC